jgi:probable phosphoglycerate mutase
MARQAAVAITRLAEFWPEIPVPSAMYSSPMVRVQETAAPIAERLGLTPVVDDRLREMEFGQWEGLTHSEIETGWPGDYERWRSEGTFAPPGGESHVDLAARIGPALGEIVESHRGEAVVVVAHAAVNRTAFGRASGMDSSRWSSLRVPPASLTILNHWPTATELVTLGFPTGWV